MKKIIIILCLCCLLSVSVFAVSNYYTFSGLWWASCLNNISGISGSKVIDGVSLDNSEFLSINGVTVDTTSNGQDTTNDFIYFQLNIDNDVELSIPLDIYLQPREYFSLCFYVSTNSPIDNLVVSDNTNTTYNVDVKPLDSFALMSNIGGSNIANSFNYEVLISFNNSTTTKNISFLTLNFDTDSTKFLFAVQALNIANIVLPDSVDNNLNNINRYLVNLYSTLSSVRTDTQNIISKLEDLIEELQNGAGSTSNYYNTIINQTPEQQAEVSAFEQKIDDIKEQVSEMREVMSSVKAPSLDDLNSSNNAGTVAVDFALANEDIGNIMTSIFQNSFIVTMLLSSISIATVGYILFGKRA